jgi:hypothetical protein
MSCKTTKKTISSSTNIEDKVEEVKTTTDTKIESDENITKKTIETITETVEVKQDSLGRTFEIPIKTTTRSIEEFSKIKVKSDIGLIELKNNSNFTVKDTTRYDRATEGQEPVKDITKGLTEGLMKAIFGDFFKYILAGVVLFVFVLILIFQGKKDVLNNEGE